MTEKEFRDWAIKWAIPAGFALYLLLRPGEVWATPEQGLIYEPYFQQAETVNNLPAGLLSRVAYQESRYKPAAVSHVGAVGLMQFMPATAAEWGIDPGDPIQAISGAGRYLRWLYDQLGDWKLTLAAYNFGIGNVKRGKTWPAETVAYVAQISKDVGLT